MKKLSFEKFAAAKIDAKKIFGGVATTYDRPSGGSGTDTVDDGDNCATYVRYDQDPDFNYSYCRG